MKKEKKDDYTIWDYLHTFFWVILVITFVVPVYTAITNPPSRSLTTWILIAYIILDTIITTLYFVLTRPTDKRIISTLNRMGYNCFMKEGCIVFKRKNIDWTITPYDISKRYRRVIFSKSFYDERLDTDHALANRLFCIVCLRNPTTHISWNGTDSCCCAYHTVLTSTRDIEREFNEAMNNAENTLGELYYMVEQAFAQQSTVPDHKIGFHMNDSETSDETSENGRQVAADTNVSAK